MSRIGRMPVVIPPGVNVEVAGNLIEVKGPKGVLKRALHRDMRVEVGGGAVRVLRPSEAKFHKALHGLTRSLVANMVEGVTKGFVRSLDVRGVGYRAAKQGNKLVLNLGYSHPVEFVPAPGVELEVLAPSQQQRSKEGLAVKIRVRGIDKEQVGATAAKIRSFRKPEPYLGKGVMYEGERVRRKAGKAGKVSK
ncbi:MAG: 50S ribosomal protein L6 [Firmicutes bacterium]|nr:50S ribosomal protein L6 [Bacillota bacterium]